ncbi:uncharacterized protein IL334_000259 [Kwoniella shivajii]|uniref:Ysc84 actin-binding domain-containing protein n=1 Tax=Kwoniella shivajii TaxID=564305 RepID=A0ABZ1CNM8_9TREE|nr:hypothetical protein IL334_000259 [Kwoniella shivajii]
MSLQPPPKRTGGATSSSASSRPATPENPGWKDKMKARGSVWGKIAIDKSVKISDNIGGRVNDIAEKRFGTEAFWPVTGDFPKEMDKCARILRSFTVDGIVTEEKEKVDPSAPNDAKKKKKVKVIRKIPPAMIASAKGLAIFTSMRTGFAPFGGAGGAGVVVAKLPDGTWSAPASISPNNLTAGFLIGVDVYDCVLVIRTQEALDSFKTHKVTIGAELAVVAGPYGAGAAVEAGLERAPLFSYVKSRGVYAGVEVVGQVFVERFDENGAMYHWPGVKAGDILAGKVKVPREAAELQSALKDAESGRAQAMKGNSLDIVVQESSDLELNEGETIKLPPTPDQTDGREYESDPETEKIHYPTQLGSHNPSPTSTPPLQSPVAVHPQGKGGRLIPPPLPSRNPNRPPLNQTHSSQSHYSDAMEGESTVDPPIDLKHAHPSAAPPGGHLDTAAEIIDLTSPTAHHSASVPGYEDVSLQGLGEIPPAYAEGHIGASSQSGYPVEKKSNSIGGLVPSDASGLDGLPMSETERREWEEYLASGSEPSAGPTAEGDNLAQRLDSQHLYENADGKGKERENSLKNPYDN